jgi:hypothetical protein
MTAAVETDSDPPEWCGQCDKRTRLIDRAGVLARCKCHPEAPRLRQYRTCPACHDQIYEWELETHLQAHDTTEERPLSEIYPEKGDVIGHLENERAGLAEQLADLRDRIDSLALGLETSARTSHPSKKSEIERGCASALRDLLRVDGESGEETRQRLDRDRVSSLES